VMRFPSPRTGAPHWGQFSAATLVDIFVILVVISVLSLVYARLMIAERMLLHGMT
jgi:competence protein ComGC